MANIYKTGAVRWNGGGVLNDKSLAEVFGGHGLASCIVNGEGGVLNLHSSGTDVNHHASQVNDIKTQEYAWTEIAEHVEVRQGSK